MGNRKKENRITTWCNRDQKYILEHFKWLIKMHDKRCGVSGSAVILSDGRGKIALFRTAKSKGKFPKIDGVMV